MKICRGKFEASNHTYVLDLLNIENFYIIFESLKNIHLPQLNGTIVATTIKNLSVNKVKFFQILIPDNKTLEKFNNICEAIQLKIESLKRRIENLEKIKNDLHKKIFSQKITIN